MTNKQKLQELSNAIDQILWEEWDPIGVNDSIGFRDEYTSYAGDICRKLLNGEGKRQIIDYLYWVENDHMGMSSTKEQADLKNSEIVDTIIRLGTTYL